MRRQAVLGLLLLGLLLLRLLLGLELKLDLQLLHLLEGNSGYRGRVLQVRVGLLGTGLRSRLSWLLLSCCLLLRGRDCLLLSVEGGGSSSGDGVDIHGRVVKRGGGRMRWWRGDHRGRAEVQSRGGGCGVRLRVGWAGGIGHMRRGSDDDGLEVKECTRWASQGCGHGRTGDEEARGKIRVGERGLFAGSGRTRDGRVGGFD